MVIATRNQSPPESTTSKSYKTKMVMKFYNQSESIRSFCKINNIKTSTFMDWKSKHDKLKSKGIDSFHENKGRPTAIDKEGEEFVIEELKKAKKRKNTYSKVTFIALINDAAEKKQLRRNLAPAKFKLTNNTVHKYKIIKAKEVIPQRKTIARIKAESDPRNALSMFSMCKAFTAQSEPEMVYNFDATQYKITSDAENETVVYIKSSEDDAPATVQSSGKLDHFIKLYHYHNAAGYAADPVFVISDDSMKADDLITARIPGLSNNTAFGSAGYLCITQTRCCNQSFYRWFLKTIICPFVEEIRKGYDSVYPDGSPMRAFVRCDGEAKQIDIFQEEESLKLLSDHLIDFAKTPASCSAICQSSDASMFFKATKKHLEGIRYRDYNDKQLEKGIKQFLDTKTTFSSDLKKVTNDSLQQLIYCIKMTIKPDIIKDGYSSIGQWPLDFKAAMSKCSREMSNNEYKTMEDHMDTLVKYYRENGQLTEENMDNLGIINVNDQMYGKLPKEERALHQQRARIMNSTDCIAQYKWRRAKKDEEAVYKAWYKGLTPEQKKDENKRKRAANKAAKEAQNNA